MKTMASGRTKGFWRRARNGLLSQDQIMAVDVQLEDDIGEIEGLVGGYLRSSQDEATRQALVASWTSSTTRRLAPTPTATSGRSW